MRQLIDVQFTDNTNYSDNTSTDIVGQVLPHNWGPVDQIVTCSYEKLLQLFPKIATLPYANVDSCFKAGTQVMEIYRPKGDATYLHTVLFKTKNATIPQLDYADYKEAYEALVFETV